MSDLHEWLAALFMRRGVLKNSDANELAKEIVQHLHKWGLIQVSTLTGEETEWGGATLRLPSTPAEVRTALEACAERERIMREALVRIQSELWAFHSYSADQVRNIATEALAAVGRKKA